jgi:hypothetical protein
MAFTLRLEQADGTPAEPPTMESTELAWAPGDRIPLGSRTHQVVRIRRENADELPVPVVEDVA